MDFIKINKHIYKLTLLTGKVASFSKRAQTEVTGSGGGGSGHAGYTSTSDVKISSLTTIHEDILIIDREGIEHSFQLLNYDIACREGNTLTVIKATKTGDATGCSIIVYNHSTKKIYYNNDRLFGFCRPHILAIISSFLALGYLTYSIPSLLGMEPEDGNLGAIMFLMLAAATFFVPRYMIKHLGYRRSNIFKKSADVAKLKEELKSIPLIE